MTKEVLILILVLNRSFNSYFKLEYLQESFVKVQPDHPEIDEEVLQRGYEVMSNSSTAFYNRTNTRSPRSVDFMLYPHSDSLMNFTPMAIVMPFLFITLLLTLTARIFCIRF